MPVDVACCRIACERISPLHGHPPPLLPQSFLWMCKFLQRRWYTTTIIIIAATAAAAAATTFYSSSFSSFLTRPHSSPLRPPPFLAGGTWLPGRRSVHTLVLEQPPRPVFSDNLPCPTPVRHFPSPFAPFFPPGSSPLPAARCILNQSLGGNAITRHHDASTIFYFKLLYVLVSPPYTPPRFSSAACTPARCAALRQ